MMKKAKTKPARRATLAYVASRIDLIEERISHLDAKLAGGAADLEGKIAHLTGVVNALKGLVNAQDVLAPHVATLSTRLLHAEQVMGEFEKARSEFQGFLDVIEILRK